MARKTAAEPKPTEKSKVTLSDSTSGAITDALRAATNAAVEGGRLRPGAVSIAVAERLAKAADAAWAEGAVTEFVQVSTKLSALVKNLGLDEAGGKPDDGEAARGPDAIARELAAILEEGNDKA